MGEQDRGDADELREGRGTARAQQATGRVERLRGRVLESGIDGGGGVSREAGCFREACSAWSQRFPHRR